MLEQPTKSPEEQHNNEKQESLESLGINNRSFLAQPDGTRGIVLCAGGDGANEFVDLYLRSGDKERVGTQSAASLSSLFHSGKLGIASLPWLSESQGQELDHRVRNLYGQRTDISSSERQNRINRYANTYRDRIAPRPEMATRPNNPIDDLANNIFNDIVGNIGKSIKLDMRDMDPEYQAQKKAEEDAKIKESIAEVTSSIEKQREADRKYAVAMRELDVREQEAKSRMQPKQEASGQNKASNVRPPKPATQQFSESRQEPVVSDNMIETEYNPETGVYEAVEDQPVPSASPSIDNGADGDVIDMEFNPSSGSYEAPSATPLLTYEPTATPIPPPEKE